LPGRENFSYKSVWVEKLTSSILGRFFLNKNRSTFSLLICQWLPELLSWHHWKSLSVIKTMGGP
jgi:hypothetical protein